jgi:hypothetical protein
MSIVGYHITTAEFERFADAMIGSRPDAPANSHLGHWFYTGEMGVSAVPGERILVCDVEPGRTWDMGLSEFQRLHHGSKEEPETFVSLRADLLARGYSSIRLVEIDGRSCILIALSAGQVRIREAIVPRAPAP